MVVVTDSRDARNVMMRVTDGDERVVMGSDGLVIIGDNVSDEA